jgi:hypothetical protein
MSATATDSDGDAITYKWTFGDTTLTGATVAATLTGDGSVTVQVTASDGKGGQATDSRSVTIGNMTGRWTFIFTGDCSPHTPTALPIMTLTQVASAVSGTLESPAAWCNVPAGQNGKLDPAAPASIDAQGNFTGARLKIGNYVDTFLKGTMDSSGRKITGVASFRFGFPDDTFEMVKQ